MPVHLCQWKITYSNRHWRTLNIDANGHVEVITGSWGGGFRGLRFRLIPEKTGTRFFSSVNDGGTTEVFQYSLVGARLW